MSLPFHRLRRINDVVIAVHGVGSEMVIFAAPAAPRWLKTGYDNPSTMILPPQSVPVRCQGFVDGDHLGRVKGNGQSPRGIGEISAWKIFLRYFPQSARRRSSRSAFIPIAGIIILTFPPSSFMSRRKYRDDDPTKEVDRCRHGPLKTHAA